MNNRLYIKIFFTTLLFLLIIYPGVSAEEPNEKAARYLKVLKKRPSPGYVFDRFYNSWLSTSTIEELESFLRKEAEVNNDSSSNLLLAFFLEKESKGVDALKLYDKALKTMPGNARLLYHKAELEIFSGLLSEAIKDLKLALKKDPDQELKIQILMQLGRAQVRAEKVDQAMKT